MKVPGADLIILLFFSAGLLFAGIGYWSYRTAKQLTQTGIAAQGVVVSLHRVDSRGPSKAPSIRFKTADGRDVLFHSSEGRNPPAYRVGQEVTLYYDPKNPEVVHLEGEYLMVYVMGGMGLFFLLFSVWSVPESIRAVWQWAFS